jgi:hypothetical protein
MDFAREIEEDDQDENMDESDAFEENEIISEPVSKRRRAYTPKIQPTINLEKMKIEIRALQETPKMPVSRKKNPKASKGDRRESKGIKFHLPYQVRLLLVYLQEEKTISRDILYNYPETFDPVNGRITLFILRALGLIAPAEPGTYCWTNLLLLMEPEKAETFLMKNVMKSFRLMKDLRVFTREEFAEKMNMTSTHTSNIWSFFYNLKMIQESPQRNSLFEFCVTNKYFLIAGVNESFYKCYVPENDIECITLPYNNSISFS